MRSPYVFAAADDAKRLSGGCAALDALLPSRRESSFRAWAVEGMQVSQFCSVPGRPRSPVRHEIAVLAMRATCLAPRPATRPACGPRMSHALPKSQLRVIW
jgi:hypothetical protein